MSPVKNVWRFGTITSMILCSQVLWAQNKDWKTFAALFDGTPGVVVFDLDLQKAGPIKSQPFMLSTAVKINQCTKEGLPATEENQILEGFSTSVEQLLSEKVKHTFAGTFAHNCVRLNYYFVTDTIGLRQEFVELYKKKFPNRTLGHMKLDKEWDVYFNFLLPQKSKYGLLKHPERIESN